MQVELTVIQKQYYRAILERNFTFLSKGSSSSSGPAVPSLINVMMELRKCCNHPYLIQGKEALLCVCRHMWRSLVTVCGYIYYSNHLSTIAR